MCVCVCVKAPRTLPGRFNLKRQKKKRVAKKTKPVFFFMLTAIIFASSALQVMLAKIASA